MQNVMNGNTISKMSSSKPVLRRPGMKQGSVLRMWAFGFLLAFAALLPGRVWAYDGISISPVNFIQVNANGSFGVQLQGVSEICPGSSFAWFEAAWGPPFNVDGQKEILATLQAAKLSGATVWLFVDYAGCRIDTVNIM